MCKLLYVSSLPGKFFPKELGQSEAACVDGAYVFAEW